MTSFYEEPDASHECFDYLDLFDNLLAERTHFRRALDRKALLTLVTAKHTDRTMPDTLTGVNVIRKIASTSLATYTLETA